MLFFDLIVRFNLFYFLTSELHHLRYSLFKA